MIYVFYTQNGKIHAQSFGANEPLPSGVLWVDLMSPTPEEEKSVEQMLGIEIPSRDEVWKNEVLNRFYRENHVSYMTAAIINKVNTPYPQTSPVTFILSEHYLLTMRDIEPTSFQIFAQRLMRYPHKFTTGPQVLEGLLEEVITRVAHNSEIVVNELDALSHDIFSAGAMGNTRKNPSLIMQAVLRRLGTYADLNSKINESLHSLSRLVHYFSAVPGKDQEVCEGVQMLISDVTALVKQTGFLSDKIAFQMDAALGMINVEQNLIIKIFSVVAVFFLPPTLLTSMYGMNFEHMPELRWVYGYPVALFFMLMCAAVPYVYFRKKGWL